MSQENENREPLDTEQMIEDAFFSNLSKKNPKAAQKITGSIGEIEASTLPPNAEKLLLNLYEVRDGLLESFPVIKSSNLSKSLIGHINVLASCIRELGGEAEDFDPIKNMSGLQTPAMVKTAERVIETTKLCYTLGKVENAFVKDDGKSIIVSFIGENDDITYKATGTITCKNKWLGNEAIDYIYCTGSGKMSVKALNENGVWIDKSNNYNVYWELEEGINGQEEYQKKEGNKFENEELNKQSSNNEDFPIEEK